MAYPNVESQPNFPALEERILDRWEQQRTFLESIMRREDEGRRRSTSSTTVHPSPTACRTTATC